MESILRSLHPSQCALIASGKTESIISSSRPRKTLPFKVYIYCTKSKDKPSLWVLNQHAREVMNTTKIADCFKAKSVGDAYNGNGKVIGEFICEEIKDVLPGVLYEWHISKLDIYISPKTLDNFSGVCHKTYCSPDCKIYNKSCSLYTVGGIKEIRCAPRSWCYVKEKAIKK